MYIKQCPDCNHIKFEKVDSILEVSFLPQAAIKKQCLNCGLVVVDIAESEEYKKMKRWEKQIRKERAEKRQMTLL